MLHFPRWKVLAILAVVLAGVVFAAPNILPRPWQDTLRHYTGLTPMVHGLDLQGGSSFLVELDTKEMLDAWIVTQVADIRAALREARIGYKTLERTADGVTVEIIDAVNIEKANELLNRLIQPLDSVAGPIFDISRSGQTFIFTFSPKAIEARIGQAVEQAMKVLENRLNGLGVTEATVQRHGRDRILIQVPGANLTEQLRKMIGQTGKLTFHAACDEQPGGQAGKLSENCAAYALKNIPDERIWVKMASGATVDGSDIDDASADTSAYTNEPVVNFKFNQRGTERFARLTRENVGRTIAIIMDELVLSAPRVIEPILGGSGQISGQFTTAEADGLALLLRSGALPTPVTYISMTTDSGMGAGAQKQDP